MQKCSYLVSIDFSFIPMIKIHFTYILDILNFVLQCCTVTLMAEMQALLALKKELLLNLRWVINILQKFYQKDNKSKFSNLNKKQLIRACLYQ